MDKSAEVERIEEVDRVLAACAPLDRPAARKVVRHLDDTDCAGHAALDELLLCLGLSGIVPLAVEIEKWLVRNRALYRAAA